MNYLGDALMTTPALTLLRQSYGAELHVIAGSGGSGGALEILRGNPDVQRLIARTSGNGWVRAWQLFVEIVRGRYDAVVILPSIPVYRFAARLARPRRLVYVPPSPDGVHMAAHMLESVAGQLGIAPVEPRMTLALTPAARREAERLLLDAGVPACGEADRPLVALNVGATRPQKRWPAASFQELARRLASRGYRPVLLGGPADRPLAARVAAGLGDTGLVDLTGQTSLANLGAVIERCAALVTADSGAMHVAAALEVPLVALFGSTDPAVTGPVGGGDAEVIYKHLVCSPCKSRPTCGGTFHCMVQILPVEVAAAVERLLPSHPRPPADAPPPPPTIPLPVLASP